MSGTIWSKFYWSDWLSDSGLRRSSLAARGLWIDMLCIAAQADPIGYLAVKKVPLSAQDIARMVGASESEAGTLIEELERNGVLSRDRNGTIFNRRMVNDAKRSATNKNNGKKGGNPSLRNDSGNPGSDNPPLKGEVKPHMPDASNQYPEKKEVGGADAPDGGKVISLKKYAFQGRVIRLLHADFDRWKQAYWAITDFTATLETADAYYAQNPPPDGKWFFQVSRWLQREHEEALKRRQRAAPDV